MDARNGADPAVLVIDMSIPFTDPSYQVGCDQSATVAAIGALGPAIELADLPGPPSDVEAVVRTTSLLGEKFIDLQADTQGPPYLADGDTLERLSYLLGIYKSLQILLPETQAADAWIRQPNKAPLFGGRSALERMLSGQVADLYVVRQYLDAQRG